MLLNSDFSENLYEGSISICAFPLQEALAGRSGGGGVGKGVGGEAARDLQEGAGEG